MFFRFPPDARWNPERSVVEFGIGIGEYEGVVRVFRRVFQILLPETPTSERCLEAYHLHQTWLELIAERKVRCKQLTDDGNVEITGRDLREREAGPSARQIALERAHDEGGTTSRSQHRTPVSSSRQDRHSARRTRQPPRSDEGMVGRQLLASAFVARCCAMQRIEIVDGVYQVRMTN